MTRRQLCQLLPGAAFQADRPPNILLIVTDDQGWWDLGCHGNRDIETPNMDRLAAEGVEFTRFYASPVCAPTRAALLTGRYYLRTGVYNTRFGGDTMRAGETTLAEALSEHGYRTAITGKWHLGPYRANDPMSQGFGHALWQSHGHMERYFHPDQLQFNRRPIEARGHITNVLTESAMAFLDSASQRPFFLYVPYNVPHEPTYVEDEYTARYLKKGLALREAQIYGMITHCDEQIGRLLRHLDQRGLRDNTVVLFMTDNGGITRHYTAGLRGAKGSTYEGGVRVPLFVRWPGKIPAGAKVDAMTADIDIAPTLCAMTGARPPANMDGKSLLPLVTRGAGESPHEYLYHIWDRHQPSLQSRWAIRDRRYKLVSTELYDLASDPGEKQNVAARHPKIVDRLRAEFTRWFRDVTQGQTFEPPPIEVGRADENPVEIQASWARLDGTHTTWRSPGGRQSAGPDPIGKPAAGSTINYSFAGYDWDSIDGWKRPGDRARWKVEVVEAGTYEVTLSYGCAPADAGGRLRISIGGSSLEVKVQATAAGGVFARFVAGELKLAKGPAWLVAEVAVAGTGELMALNRIWLRRTGAPASK
jgi:arylsulfatase A